jgi:hypothetical protein
VCFATPGHGNPCEREGAKADAKKHINLDSFMDIVKILVWLARFSSFGLWAFVIHPFQPKV